MKNTSEKLVVLKRVAFVVLTLAIMYMILPQSVVKAARSTDYEYNIVGSNATITDYYGSAENVTIPNKLDGYTVTGIGDKAFDYCLMKKVTIPDSVNSIGEQAFCFCKNLKEINIPEKVTIINAHTFYTCESLEKIVLPNNLTEIKYYAFLDCNNLKSVNIPNKVFKIGSYAFAGCNLTDIVFPSNLNSIGYSAFYNCSLENVTFFSQNPPTIESYSFAKNDKLTKIYVPVGSRTAYENVAQLASYSIVPRDGKYVTLELDYDTYLKNNITMPNLERWMKHLDDAYEAYYELVGRKPANGQKIRIIDSTEYSAWAWAYSNTNVIGWHKNHIKNELISIDKNDDWSFGILHEMGHLFDLDGRWNFDGEFFANFKMAYVLYKYDKNFVVYMNGKRTNYNSMIEYYEKDYTNKLGNLSAYSNDGFTYMLLEHIANKGDWDCIKSTFRYFNDLSNSQLPSSKVEKYDMFFDKVHIYSGKIYFMFSFMSKYTPQYNFTRNYFINNP